MTKRHAKAFSKRQIEDIAIYVGLSKIAVADHLSGVVVLPERAARRIDAAVLDLGIASQEEAKIRPFVLIIPTSDNAYFGQMASSFDTAAYDRGWPSITIQTAGSVKREVAAIDSWQPERTSGIALFTNNGSDMVLRNCVANRYDIVLIGEPLFGKKASSVFSDFVSVGEIAAQHLIACGHLSFAFVGGPHRTSSSMQISGSFRTALRKAFGQELDHRQFFGTHSPGHGWNAMEQMSQKRSLPTAILAGSTAIAKGIARWCASNSGRLREPPYIVAYDLNGQLLNYPFVTISSDMREFSNAALELIVKAHESPGFKIMRKLPTEMQFPNETMTFARSARDQISIR